MIAFIPNCAYVLARATWLLEDDPFAAQTHRRIPERRCGACE
jgi:hypothetical protein